MPPGRYCGLARSTYVVSLGAEGAFLAHRDELVRLPAIPISSQGAAGAGDSFLAALVLALTATRPLTERWGLPSPQARQRVVFGTAIVSQAMVRPSTPPTLPNDRRPRLIRLRTTP